MLFLRQACLDRFHSWCIEDPPIYIGSHRIPESKHKMFRLRSPALVKARGNPPPLNMNNVIGGYAKQGNRCGPLVLLACAGRPWADFVACRSAALPYSVHLMECHPEPSFGRRISRK